MATKKSSKKSDHGKRPEISELAKLALRSLVRAQKEAARENARFGLPLIVWEKGRVVEIPTVPPKRISKKQFQAAQDIVARYGNTFKGLAK